MSLPARDAPAGRSHPSSPPPPAEEHTVAQLTAVSKLLSKVLRHEPELVGAVLDAQGWTTIDGLLRCIARAARAPDAPKRLRALPPLTEDLLLAVVATNDKQRFAISADGKRIRAVQGHSVEVELEHPVMAPPPVLFHGTAAGNWPSISREGLKPRARHAVHLSADSTTARKVGARHGRPLVLVVASGQMHAHGFSFSRADNGVWLVNEVPPSYLSLHR